MGDLVNLSAGAQRAMTPGGTNLVDLDAERRARLQVEFGTNRRFVRASRRTARSTVEPFRTHPRPALGRDGPDAA